MPNRLAHPKAASVARARALSWGHCELHAPRLPQADPDRLESAMPRSGTWSTTLACAARTARHRRRSPYRAQWRGGCPRTHYSDRCLAQLVAAWLAACPRLAVRIARRTAWRAPVEEQHDRHALPAP